MPEAPEVSLITLQLNKELKNANILEFIFSKGGRYQSKSPIGFIDIKNSLPLKIVSIKNKGKFIYWEFSNGMYMFNTLGLSGIWMNKKGRNPSIEIIYNKINENEGSKITKNQTIYFDDQRHFGTVKFVKNLSELEKKLKTIGPDILNSTDKELNYTIFKDRLTKKKNWNITKALMNQSIISGIGNYIKAESLYVAGISPHLQVYEIDDIRLNKLYNAAKDITIKSFQLQGMSLRHFKDIKGNEGEFVENLEVYGRKIDKNGNKVIREITKDGRTTYWVKEIQY